MVLAKMIAKPTLPAMNCQHNNLLFYSI
jgi:hypothetical protein